MGLVFKKEQVLDFLVELNVLKDQTDCGKCGGVGVLNRESLEFHCEQNVSKAMFECSSKCCDNLNATGAEFEHCLEECNANLAESHLYVTTEIHNYKGRLQRCIKQCNDEAKDQLGATPTLVQVDNANRLYERCACACIDKHIDTLPQFMSKVHEVMKKKVASATGENIPMDDIFGPI